MLEIKIKNVFIYYKTFGVYLFGFFCNSERLIWICLGIHEGLKNILDCRFRRMDFLREYLKEYFRRSAISSLLP
ncbi:hypothetical protein COY05_01895 [Candidatus Peregrinibacteria bacterium CG_4_10_14_0_2_um_filter_38_24]|nr:MAG: hypothetical protein COY05_01895 [Candidatus Peregrinibacteria bacterium CG_4_10_14_0_2_um_filter_38_24]PJC38537.1 MAG: hypothetical protein CO044_04490 [Candidatus Peregrinibacteria bacterium CG_4_9_14_0_2_um_filter_38_9]